MLLLPVYYYYCKTEFHSSGKLLWDIFRLFITLLQTIVFMVLIKLTEIHSIAGWKKEAETSLFQFISAFINKAIMTDTFKNV